MPHPGIQRWFEAWGYDKAPDALHRAGDLIPASHPFQAEIQELLRPDGGVGAAGAFDVERVPTVCFLEGRGLLVDETRLDKIREKVWNQNLISIVVVIDDDQAQAIPAIPEHPEVESIKLAEAGAFSRLSRADIQAGGPFLRRPDWFQPQDRVDQTLLRNLGEAVKFLVKEGLDQTTAQFLMAQILFIRYLEDRQIIGDNYRRSRNVESLASLIQSRDHRGIVRLLNQLNTDFNGDILKPQSGNRSAWTSLSVSCLKEVELFLRGADLDSRQDSLFGYDFSYLPVELISGIYESFLNEDRAQTGAYYTPRHLASLVIDQALSESEDVLKEIVYDGACGSGILLTTAFRRLLAHAEERAGHPLSFTDRINLLTKHIHGSDINESAIKVTAFSLYLALLEQLNPSDVAKLIEDTKTTLPDLKNENLFAGPAEGDFFSPKNPMASQRNCTLFVSNPPWVEPNSATQLPSDKWAASSNFKLPRRQVAAGFMHRAFDYLKDGGRIAVMLPASLLAAPTSQQFTRQWLERFSLHTLINFGDLRKLLFATARNPCMVATGQRRAIEDVGHVPGAESFEYWAPKADISIAFGRLTLQSTDRKTIATRQLAADNSVLTALFWGSEFDWSMLHELRARGTLGDLIGPTKRWRTRKGFHRQDRNVAEPVSARGLRAQPFLHARSFPTDAAVIDQDLLQSFPAEIKTVANLPDDLRGGFSGPRILFKDGLSRDRAVCAAFSDQPFSFQSSLGVIVGSKSDKDLLRFTAAYLHSDLVRYCLLLGAWQVAFERERVTLMDIKRLPFILPEDHEDPKRAHQIIREVAALTKPSEELFRRLRDKQSYEERLNRLIAEYFGLTDSQRIRVNDVARYLLPSVQPGSYARLRTPAQERVSAEDAGRYLRALQRELVAWQTSLGGQGQLRLSGTVSTQRSHGPLGVIRVDLKTSPDAKTQGFDVSRSDETIRQILTELEANGLLPLEAFENLYLAADVVVFHKDALYLIKPLLRRLWLASEAQVDAVRAVREIQRLAYSKPLGKAS